MIPVSKMPILAEIEDDLLGWLSRKYLANELPPSSTGEVYFDAIDGEIVARPDWSLIVRYVVERWEAAKE